MASETETLKKDMAELQSTIDKLTKDMGQLSKAVGEDLQSRANGSAAEIKDRARKVAANARDKGRESVEAVETHVSENPLRSLIVAFGAGILISQLLRRG